MAGTVTSAQTQDNQLLDFPTCLANLKATARAQGISTAAIESTLNQVEQLPRVIAADRKQPEFTQTFTDYYQARVTSSRVSNGRNNFGKHLPLLAPLAANTGVPAQYLMAFWGLETNFGRYFGKLYIPSALATLACDPRRADFFTQQLLATLKIVDHGHMQPAQLLGSWAGAIGHMQFMPSTFLQHARDADGDNKADLYGSIADAMLSAATYLNNMGWQTGYRWGREVTLPTDFDYANSGIDTWRPLTFWSAAGVMDTQGRAMPSLALESALLLPSGRQGPAFLVYPNFRIIMKWNRSEFYALSVGRLADRIAGAGRLHTKLLAYKISTAKIISLQQQLTELGYAPGEADGVLGPATRLAIQQFQQDKNMPADGYPSLEVLSLLAP